MKHAILITAYTDSKILLNLINHLKNDFLVYVHIDKKSKIQKTELLCENVFVFKKYKINWASYNHLAAIIYLLKQATKNNNIEYFHVISGQDFPIKSNKEIIDYFEIHKEENFLDVNKLSEMDVSTKKAIEERFRLYWFTDFIKHPKSFNFKENFWLKKIQQIQTKIKIRRLNIGEFSQNEIYKGLVYCSLHKNAILYILDYIKNNKTFTRDLKLCFIAEEFFFQTILMNSKFKSTIVNNNLRYMDWSYRDGISPCVLNESDYDKIIVAEALFMRKVSSKSSKLIRLIHNKNEKI